MEMKCAFPGPGRLRTLLSYGLLNSFIVVVVGKISKGERVLVHAAGSGVGTAVLQLLRSTVDDVTVLVTAGRQDKLEKAKLLGARDAFNYKDGNFAQKVLNATEGLW